MRTFTCSGIRMYFLFFCCFLWSSSTAARISIPLTSTTNESQPGVEIIGGSPAMAMNQAPAFIFSDPGSTYVGNNIQLEISANDPDAGDLVTLQIDSMVFFSGYTEANFAGAIFSPALPLTAAGTASTNFSWVPKDKHKGYVVLYLSAEDQHGNKTIEEYYFFIDIPLVTEPIPAVQLAVNEPFQLIIPIADADWHEIYEPQLLEEAPQWLKVGKIPADEYASADAIHISGTPGPADLGNYEFTLYLRALFGQEVTQKLRISVFNGKNQTWHRDSDGDGYGVLSKLDRLTSVTAPEGFANKAGDCNDADAAINPGATEIPADGIDNNCNGQVDEAASCLAQQKLVLTAECSDKPAEKRWMVYNPNSCAVQISWWMHKTSQKGKLLVPPGNSYFTSTSIAKGPEVAYISWKNEGGHIKKAAVAASTAKCNKVDKNKNARTAEADLAKAEGLNRLEAYPMPFSNSLHLGHSSMTASSAVKIHLYSIDGKQYDISSAVTAQEEGKIELALGSTSIPAGIYILKLWVGEQAPLHIRVIKRLQ